MIPPHSESPAVPVPATGLSKAERPSRSSGEVEGGEGLKSIASLQQPLAQQHEGDASAASPAALQDACSIA